MSLWIPYRTRLPPTSPPRPGELPSGYRELGSEGDLPDDLVVPFAIGRNRIKPVAIFNSKTWPVEYDRTGWRTPRYFQQSEIDTEDLITATPAFDAVLAFCQAGDATYPVTLQGLWKGKAYVGARWNGSAWTTVGTSIWKALRRLMRSKDVGGHWEPDGASSYRWDGTNTFQAAPHELITSTVSPYGKRYVGPLDVYEDITGSYPAWGYLAGSSLAGAGFHGLTHLRAEQLACDTVLDTALPKIEALIDTYGGPEVHGVTAVRAVLERLLGEDPASIETAHGPDGRTESSFQAWCDANPDLRVNGLVTGSPRAALDEMLAALNAELVQTDGKICIWPLGDAVVGSYQPAYYWSNAWHPTVIDRREIQGGIQVRFTDESDVFNAVRVKYLDRAKDYQENFQAVVHNWHAGRFGRRQGETITCRWISTAKAANLLGQFAVRRSVNQRKRFKARLCPRWSALQVGDLIQLGDGIYTDGAWTDTIDIPPTLVRVSKRTRRADDGSIEIEGWAWAYGAIHPIDLTPDQPAAPAMIESPAVGQSAQVGAVIAGGAIGGGNLLRNSSFEGGSRTETGVGVLPDGWGPYNNGGEACTYSLQTGGVHGGKFARVTWSVLNANTRGWYTRATVSIGGRTAGVQGGWRVGQWYVVSWWARGDAALVAAGAGMSSRFNTDPGERFAVANPALSTSWQRYVYRLRWTGTAPVEGELYVTTDANVASGQLDLDAVQVEEGERETAYAPGTWDAEAAASDAQSTATGAAEGVAVLTTSKNAFTRSATPPGSPVTGDLWSNSDTTTNCPDNACKGHTETGGTLNVGAYPHRKTDWIHRWDGSAWVDAQAADKILANELVVSSLSAISANLGEVTAGTALFGGYTEDANGVPNGTGAKVFGNPSGPCIKVPPTGIQVGKFTMGQIGALAAWGIVNSSYGTLSRSATPAHIDAVSYYDRGASLTPRYVIRVHANLSSVMQGVMVVRNAISANPTHLPVVVGSSGNASESWMDVGFWTGSAWVTDFSAAAYAFHFIGINTFGL